MMEWPDRNLERVLQYPKRKFVYSLGFCILDNKYSSSQWQTKVAKIVRQQELIKRGGSVSEGLVFYLPVFIQPAVR
jgi:hypothetical protein